MQEPGLETLLQKAIDKSSLIQNSCLDPRATHTYYFAVLRPSLSYTLPVSHYSNQALDTVDKKIAIPFLNKLGYSRSTPRPVQYGPLKYGGVNLHPLKDIRPGVRTNSTMSQALTDTFGCTATVVNCIALGSVAKQFPKTNP
jgi:hypothetical protein